ncbi:trans-sialidase-like protein [Diaporthe sp. PMI_573]|nr:trans-sialidase-like protein [Diaporthaceae sp. PMI_573]
MSGPPPPPPPPPHGESPKTTSGSGSGLPPGKYDVFIIPEHSAGSGFLYLPSLRTNTNSFIAGFASALIMVVLGQSMAPAFQAWWANFQGMGNAGMLLLVIAVGLGAWSLGRQSSDSTGRDGAGGGGGFYSGGSSMPGGGGFSSAGSSPHSAHHGSPPGTGPPPDAHSPPPPPGGSKPSANQSNGSYQRPPQPPPQPQSTKPQAETPKNSWQKARDEVRRKEEERKAKDAEDKRRAEAAQRLKELREREARERAQREADRTRREQEAKDKLAQEQAARDKEAKEKEEKERKEKGQREAREKELRERLAREREERRKKLEEDRRRREGEAATQARSTSSYAYSGVGEKTSPWPNGKPPTPSSPTKNPPPPTAKTFVGDDSDAYSYRPYDQPRRPARRNSKSDMSESSWAPSQSTARTSPPPSVRGPYSTKDPDKIVIKAVYCFMNQFAKTPASQLVSGVGTVTDGLILRITTEGLFIDDDIRGVAQREWDVKAWTLKTVEVWCPVHFLTGAIAANSPSPTGSKSSSNPALSGARLRAAERGAPKSLSGDEADAYLADVLRSCKGSCRLGDCAVASGSTRVTNSTAQTGDWKAKGLHLLRATIRDQEGKRYMFVIGEEDGWKVAVGLQRLRRGTQVRALGVAGLSGLETKSTLEMLGWG